MTPAPSDETLRKKLYNVQVAVTPAVIPFGYIVGLVLGISREDSPFAVLAIALPLAVVAGLAGSGWMLPKAIGSALAERPDDRPGARLTRILELPRRIELGGLVGSLALVVVFGLLACARFHLPYTRLAGVVAATFVFRLFVSIPQHIASERILMPAAVAEFRRHPATHPAATGFRWPRLGWYLPYAFALALVTSIGTVMTIVLTTAARAQRAVIADFAARGQPELAHELESRIHALQGQLVLPVVTVGLFFMMLAVVIAWMFAKRQQEATRALEASLQVIAGGSSSLPEWVATDELGDLAFGLGAIYEKLEGVAQLLQRSGERLSVSGADLSRSATKQSDTVTRQAAALQEARITAEEIRQTSALAARKSEEILQHAESAEAIREAGEAAIDQSLSGLDDIRAQVGEIAGQIRTVGERASQVASITETVKSLADQSNMLALNAAIEAVRSGEHGKGFAVVAREMRSLADQSLRATARVRDILHDAGDAIQLAVQTSQKGEARVAAAVGQLRTSGDRLRQLAEIVHQNLEAVRQISAAVGQQNSGISQVGDAVGELSEMMSETVAALKATEEAARLVQSVGQEVARAMVRYQVEDDAVEPAAELGTRVAPV